MTWSKQLEDLGTMWGFQRRSPPPEEGVPPMLAAAPEANAQQELAAADNVGATVQPQAETATPGAAPGAGIQTQPQAPQMAAAPQPQLLQQTTQYTPGVVETPEMKFAKSQQHLAQMAQANAVEEHANAQAEGSRLTANVLADQNQKLEASIREEQAKKVEIEQKAEKAQADYESAVKDYNDNKKVNPNRFMENLGTGGQILASIAQAFGAFGSAITHSPNYAAEQIQKAIDRDVRAQEHEIAARGQAVDLQRNRVAYFRARGLDLQSASSAARLTMLQESQQKIAQITAQVGEQSQKALGQQMAQQIQERIAKTEYDNQAAQQAKATTQSVSGYPAGGGGKSLPAETASNLGGIDGSIKMVDTLYKDWKEKAASTGSGIKSAIPWVQTDAKQYEDARGAVVAHIGRALGEKGTFSEKDAVRYYNALPSPWDTAERAAHKVKVVKAMMINDFDARKGALTGAGFNTTGINLTNRPPRTFTPEQQ